MLKEIVDKQMKSRYLIWFVLFGIISGIFFGALTGRGSSTTYVLDDWDSYIAGALSGSNSLHSWKVDSTNSYSQVFLGNTILSSPNSLRYGAVQTGVQTSSYLWMNLSSSYSYISYFSSVFKLTTQIAGSTYPVTYFYFYNGSSEVIKIRFSCDSLHAYIHVLDVTGTYQLMYTSPSSSITVTNCYLNMSHFSDNRFNYSFFINGVTHYLNTTCYMNGIGGIGYHTFDRVFISQTEIGTSNSIFSFFFDDIKFMSDTSYPGGEVSSCDFSGYSSFCDGPSYGVYAQSPGGNQYVETRFNMPVNGFIQGVTLPISVEQHNLVSSNLSDYSMYINGILCGHPSVIIPQGTQDYALQWCGLNVFLDDEYPLFSFSCSAYVQFAYKYYWYGIGLNPSPVGIASSRYHNDLSYYTDATLDGFVYPGGTISMCYYYSSFSFNNETSPYNDLVTSSKTVFHTWDTVPVYYFISDYIYSNTLQLWHNGTQMTTQGYPYTISSGDFNGELSFLPFQIGSYQLRLVRNSIVRSRFNFTVTYPADTDFILSPYPNPCLFNKPVSIFYRYYPDDGAEGFIGVSEFSDTSNTLSFDEFWTLAANTTGNKSFIPQTPTYVSLWKKTGSTYYRVAIVYLRMISPFDNTINAQYQSIMLTDAYPAVSQRIYGTQNVQGFNTFIRLNGKVLQDVTDTSFYSLYATITKAGLYVAELCMTTSNGTIVLASVNFRVTSSIGVGTGGGAEAFSPELKALFGICFVIVSVCVPLMISVKYHVNVPTFVYVIFMAFGIGLGTKLGFLDLWLVFLFVVALVAGAVYTIFGHGGPGPGPGQSSGGGTIRERVFTRRSGDEGVRKNGR